MHCKDVWPHEAQDFTPWLAENLDKLGVFPAKSVLPEWDNGEIIALTEPGMGLHLDAAVLEEYKVY